LEQVAPYYTALQGLVVESAYNWYWLVDGLMEGGYRVHLANPAAMQQYDPGSRGSGQVRGFFPQTGCKSMS
jgi:hypothetical protein